MPKTRLRAGCDVINSWRQPNDRRNIHHARRERRHCYMLCQMYPKPGLVNSSFSLRRGPTKLHIEIICHNAEISRCRQQSMSTKLGWPLRRPWLLPLARARLPVCHSGKSSARPSKMWRGIRHPKLISVAGVNAFAYIHRMLSQ